MMIFVQEHAVPGEFVALITKQVELLRRDLIRLPRPKLRTQK